jgi:hypothetical protein
MNNSLYLEDYSNEDIIEKNLDIEDINPNKPQISLKPDYNSKGERIVVFSIHIPLKNEDFKIDILINNDMYKNIGKHF